MKTLIAAVQMVKDLGATGSVASQDQTVPSIPYVQCSFRLSMKHSQTDTCYVVVLMGFTQNDNDSFNSILSLRCPKHRFNGPKNVRSALASAPLQFNEGACPESGWLT